jgi:hypothetical protein
MSKAANARSKFAELRALRESGKKRLDTYQVEQEDDLYEEVDEDGYKKVVRERLNQDDFVVDDNGEGYADDGREEWDRPGYRSDSDEDLPVKGRTGKAGEFTFGSSHSSMLILPQPNGNARKTRPRKSQWTKGLVITLPKDQRLPNLKQRYDS